MGLGSFGGGRGAARHLARLGYDVTVTDLRSAEALEPELRELADLELHWALGEHRPEDFRDLELLCVNPAIAPGHRLVEGARAGGARITSEIELFLEAVDARLFCITGTQGKSSTAHVLSQLLEAAGVRVHLGGNIGGSLLPRLGTIGPGDACVLELSSYQLEALASPPPRLRRVESVCVTNVLADHLERHGSLDAYARAKRRILELGDTSSLAFLPAGDRRIDAWTPRGRRVSFGERAGAELSILEGGFRFGEETLGNVEELRLPGRFQRWNVLCALGMARAAGVAPETLCAAVPDLRGLPHRMEDLGRRRGRRVVDNAVSTTPDSTFAALRELGPGTTLLVGGRRKELPFDELAHLAAAKEAFCVCFGESGDGLLEEFTSRGARGRRAATVEEACELAFEHTSPEGCILFSPACASFDAYPNFRARALAFRDALPPEDGGHLDE